MLERIRNYSSVARRVALGQVSSAIFGNDAGVLNNVLGARLIRAAQHARSQDWPYATPEADTLRSLGFVKLSPDYGDNLLRRLSSQFSALIEDPGHSMARSQSADRGQPDASRRLIDALASMPELGTLINAPVQKALLAYYGGHFQWIETMAYRNRHVMDRTKEVYSNVWHFDHINTAYLQLFIYLSDNVNAEETGAFRIIARDQSRRISRRGYLHRRIVLGPARHMVNDPTIVHHMEGALGTAFLVANARCLHAAGVPAPGRYRDVAILSFLPSTEPFAGRMTPLDHHSYGI